MKNLAREDLLFDRKIKQDETATEAFNPIRFFSRENLFPQTLNFLEIKVCGSFRMQR